ncbi:unnamed protein product [Candidula unifasciata]|uniref:Methyltransferase FkbM domain-containing protein n=1 Tax=Candidula unifasciata TaxID=100452 RepID=A0A8S3ZMM1_9EUPU|nr:unnamed protein product [Candidula unifasciata]
MILLDIGCNIGVYTVWVAALGNRVVALDMVGANLHLLQLSLYLNRLGKKVTLINNAVYRDHRTLEAFLGASRLNTSKPFKVQEDQSRTRVRVRTICLNDLVPLLKDQTIYMKMDIENTEHHALACADQLFRHVNIKIVQMEWHRRVPEESKPILNFMAAHGYAASLSSVQLSPVSLVTIRRNIDVFFLKKSAFH